MLDPFKCSKKKFGDGQGLSSGSPRPPPPLYCYPPPSPPSVAPESPAQWTLRGLRTAGSDCRAWPRTFRPSLCLRRGGGGLRAKLRQSYRAHAEGTGCACESPICQTDAGG